MAGLLALLGLISFPSRMAGQWNLIRSNLLNRITAAGTAPEFPFYTAEQVTGFPFNVFGPNALGQPQSVASLIHLQFNLKDCQIFILRV